MHKYEVVGKMVGVDSLMVSICCFLLDKAESRHSLASTGTKVCALLGTSRQSRASPPNLDISSHQVVHI